MMGDSQNQSDDIEEICTFKVGDLALKYRFYPASAGNKAVVLLHGWMHSSIRWQSLAHHLSDRYTVFAPDWPGFGLSDVECSACVGLDDLASVANKFFEEIQAKYQIQAVIGHSMGGLILLRAITKYGLVCEQIGLCSVPVGWTRLMRFMWHIRRFVYPFMRFMAWLPRRISCPIIRLLAWLSIHSYKLIDDSIVQDALKANILVADHCLQDILNTVILAEVENLQHATVLVTRGKYDLIVDRENSQSLSEYLDGVYYEFAGVSHTPQLETAAEFNAVWSAFIDTPQVLTTWIRNEYKLDQDRWPGNLRVSAA